MRTILLLLSLTLATSATPAMPPPLPRAAVDRSLSDALAFLATAQNQDGSFGASQRRLQTSLAILAFLSQGKTPDTPDSPLPAAITWLLQNTTQDGFLGDSEYPMESHAIAGLALSECLGMIPDPDLARQVAQRAEAAFNQTLKLQDKAVGADYYGGWKPNPKAKANDRRVTAWCLLYIRSMQLRGYDVSDRATKRALDFMEGSQKHADGNRQLPREDIGGFSYDAAGLPIVSVTGAGFACMAIYQRDSERRSQALDWLSRNRPIWYGPNFYLSYFFAARGYSRERHIDTPKAIAAQNFANRMWELLREHQRPDGAFDIPPGNAENTKDMGATYATPMAILILNAERDLMPIDATN